MKKVLFLVVVRVFQVGIDLQVDIERNIISYKIVLDKSKKKCHRDIKILNYMKNLCVLFST